MSRGTKAGAQNYRVTITCPGVTPVHKPCTNPGARIASLIKNNEPLDKNKNVTLYVIYKRDGEVFTGRTVSVKWKPIKSYTYHEAVTIVNNKGEFIYE